MNGAVDAMLAARSVAVVGASPVPGSFGERMVLELSRSPGVEELHLVNPRYARIGERPCLPCLADIGHPVDLVLLGVADRHLPGQLSAAAALGARGCVIYGSAHGDPLRAELRDTAVRAGMAVCGAGCMGFVNAGTGLRALGYLERDPLPPGDVALVTHSGSVFSALLRARRAFGFGLAVSSGQELVTTAADYVEHALQRTPSRLVALVLETVRDGARLRCALHAAAEQDVPVVLLPVGGSAAGSSMVAAHSGALAGDDGMWEALCEDTGALRVHDLSELADTLELIGLARRPRAARPGIATVHDSGAERALTADLAAGLGVPFAPLSPATLDTLAGLLDDGLAAANPLDVWGTGADTRELLAGCLRAVSGDPAVGVTALAVDLVPEYDGDTSYPDAVLDVAASAPGPLAVLASLPSAIDQDAASRLRAAGVAVLEGTRSGLVAMRHLLALGTPLPACAVPAVDPARRDRWRARLASTPPWGPAESFALLKDYGVPVVPFRVVHSAAEAARAASELGFPVVLKTADPAVAHKSDGGGVVLGLAGPDAVAAAYPQLARPGPEVLVSRQVPAGVELAAGLVLDPHLGPLVVCGAGGTLVELIGDRAVACPPLGPERASAMLDRLRIAPLLNGFRGATVDRAAVVRVVLAISQLAVELGDLVAAVDVNPVICSPEGALAVDVLVVPAPGAAAAAQKIA